MMMTALRENVPLHSITALMLEADWQPPGPIHSGSVCAHAGLHASNGEVGLHQHQQQAVNAAPSRNK